MRKFVLIALLLICGSASAIECRSHAAKHAFDVMHGYPHGRKGFIVDHVCALACGGVDNPLTNMQYQTLAESKEKDKWETTRAGCKATCNSQNSTYPIRRVFNCR